MKHFRILAVLALAVCGAAGCEKEGKLSPTGPENIYGDHTLPQGNHDYDARIVKLFEDYNTLFLYKYVPHDLYYAGTRWMGGTYDPVKDTTYQHNGNQANSGYFDVPSDEDYVGDQLDLLHEVLLDYYPDRYLSQYLPQKVFMIDSLYWSYTKKGIPDRNITQAYEGGDFIALTWGGARITTMTPQQKKEYQNDVNKVFMSMAIRRGGGSVQDDFSEITNYNLGGGAENGLLPGSTSNPNSDWKSYIDAISSTPYAVMTAEGGFLHPDVDINGLVRKKYDIVVGYFTDTHGVDLQAIGNETFGQ